MSDELWLDVPTKKPKVSVVMDEELKSALEAWAAKERRTVSNLCELLLKNAVEQAQASGTLPKVS